MIESKSPLVAVDTVVFGMIEERFNVLLIQIGEGPYASKWALPGGLVEYDESLDDCAIRVLTEKTDIKNIYLEQLYTFGNPSRDVRGRSIAVCYFALVPNPEILDVKTLDYYTGIKWHDVRHLPDTAFDHRNMIELAHERLMSKLSYTNIAYSLLPDEFTLSELQRIYEIILGEKLDKRNFRKKMLSLDILEYTNKSQEKVVHRPAKLYKFKTKEIKFL